MAAVGRRVALVGGTAGMGFAAAQVLAALGDRVALIGRDAGRAADKARTLAEATGAKVLGLGGAPRVTPSASTSSLVAVSW